MVFMMPNFEKLWISSYQVLRCNRLASILRIIATIKISQPKINILMNDFVFFLIVHGHSNFINYDHLFFFLNS